MVPTACRTHRSSPLCTCSLHSRRISKSNSTKRTASNCDRQILIPYGIRFRCHVVANNSSQIYCRICRQPVVRLCSSTISDKALYTARDSSSHSPASAERDQNNDVAQLPNVHAPLNCSSFKIILNLRDRCFLCWLMYLIQSQFVHRTCFVPCNGMNQRIIKPRNIWRI